MKTINKLNLFTILLISSITIVIIYFLSTSYKESFDFSGHKARGQYGCDNYIGESIKFINTNNTATFEFKTSWSPINWKDIVFHDVSVHDDNGNYHNIDPVYYDIMPNDLLELNKKLKNYLKKFDLTRVNPRDHLKVGYNGKIKINYLNQYISSDSISLYFEDTLIYGYDYLKKVDHAHHHTTNDTIPKNIYDSLLLLHQRKDYRGQFGCGSINKSNFNIDNTLYIKMDTIKFINCFEHPNPHSAPNFVGTVYYLVDTNLVNKWNKSIKKIPSIDYNKFGVAFEDKILKDNNNQYYVTKSVDLYYGAIKL